MYVKSNLQVQAHSYRYATPDFRPVAQYLPQGLQRTHCENEKIGYIDVKPVVVKRLDMLQPRKWCGSADIQRLGCVAVHFGEGKLQE